MEWEVVRNYDKFIAIVNERGLPNIVSFDHDLADIKYGSIAQKESFEYHENTGADCAAWMIEYCINNGFVDFPKYYIHSANTVGGPNIDSKIKTYEKDKKMGLFND